MKKTSKRGAIELSIGTIVIIVLAMSMLILGIVLVRNIFSTATDSVDILDDKIKGELNNIFADETSNVIVKAGTDRTIKIKPDSGVFGVAIAASTLDGSSTDRARLQYKLTVENPTGKNCASILGGTKAVENLLVTSTNTYLQFDEFQGANAYAVIQINIPSGTATCTQKVFIDVIDKQATTESNQVGGSYFIIDVLKEGFF